MNGARVVGTGGLASGIRAGERRWLKTMLQCGVWAEETCEVLCGCFVWLLFKLTARGEVLVPARKESSGGAVVGWVLWERSCATHWGWSGCREAAVQRQSKLRSPG